MPASARASICRKSGVGADSSRQAGGHRRGRGRATRPSPATHHVLGLLGFVFLSTFIFSGLMSMSPWGLFDSAVSQAEQVDAYTGGPIRSFESFPKLDQI